MLSMVTMFTSCEKDGGDDPIVPTITEADLVGNWNFVSLSLNGSSFTSVELDEMNKTMNYVKLSLLDVKATSNYGPILTIYDIYEDAGGFEPFKVEDNKIKCSCVFTVINATDVLNGTNTVGDKEILKLKLESASGVSNAPIGYVYTLEK